MSTADDESPAVSVADIGDTGEGGKLKMIVSLVKKCLGVKDIASMSVSSLPRTGPPSADARAAQASLAPGVPPRADPEPRVLALPRPPRPLRRVRPQHPAPRPHPRPRPLTARSINDSEDAFERMLAVLRFTFSKDIRHAVRPPPPTPLRRRR
jgi:hypothetical protein